MKLTTSANSFLNKMGICCNLMYDYLLVWILWHASICAFLWSCAEMYRNCHYMYLAAGISFYLISSYLTSVLYVIFYCGQSWIKVSLFSIEARASAGLTLEDVSNPQPQKCASFYCGLSLLQISF